MAVVMVVMVVMVMMVMVMMVVLVVMVVRLTRMKVVEKAHPTLGKVDAIIALCGFLYSPPCS
jgi:hypothetical protein